MSININELYKIVKDYYDSARKSLIKKALFTDSYEPLSDVVPGYEAKQLEFGSFAEDNFTVLFIDIRHSTKRAMKLGAEKTFLSLHAFYHAATHVIEHYNGIVIDMMGDGIMAFFGGNHSGLARKYAIKQAGQCAMDLQKVIDKVVNPIIEEDQITWKISCGVGIDHGKVIVTKIGNEKYYDVKAFGDCINHASKLSGGTGGSIIVTKKIKQDWPTSKKGKISFSATTVKNTEGYYLTKNN